MDGDMKNVICVMEEAINKVPNMRLAELVGAQA
jgi:hypothetical protein